MKDRIIAAVAVTALAAALIAFAPRHAKKQVAAVAVPEASPAVIEAAMVASAAPAAVAAPVAAVSAPAPVAAPSPAPVVASAPAPVAAPARAAAPAAGRADAPIKEFWGVVDSIDAAAGTLAVKDRRGRVHALKLAADVHATKGGDDAPEPVSQIKAGDAVMAAAVGGTVRSIHVRILFAGN
jgi:hypothetical protein